MIPFLESVTIAQAALLAAVSEALLAAYYASTLFAPGPLLVSNPSPVLLSAVIPTLAWCAYFWTLSRDRRGLATPVSFRTATWIALAFGLFLQTLALAYLQITTMFLIPVSLLRIVSWMIRVGWALLLLALALAPDRPRTRRIALVVLILSAPSALDAIYAGVWDNPGTLVWNDSPLQAFWRVFAIPAVRIFYWLTQILFLWKVSGNPGTRDSIETLSAHLAP